MRKSGGVFALQAIVIENERFEAYRRSADSIQKHIFRAARCLVPMCCATRRAAGLQWTSAAGYGLDYAYLGALA